MADTTSAAQDSVGQTGSTTNFVSDTQNVAHATIVKPKDIGSMFNSSLDIYSDQDIKEFLRKPVKLLAGSFTTTDSAILTNLDPYTTFLTNSMIANKVSGHLAIRAKLVIRIVVNANRFQQGRYYLAFFPTGGCTYSGVQAVAWFNMHTANQTLRTQLPKVEFDLNRESEAVIEVPWMSTFSHMLVKGSYSSGFTSPGRLLLCTYSPLVAPTGSVVADYSIYAHFEDVSLQTPTQPQARANFKSSSNRRSPVSDVQSTEQAAAGVGPVSSALSKVSQAADLVAQIPILSAIAAPVAWFTDIAAGVASIFGWSNPLDLSEVTRAVQTIIPYANNCDMIDSGMPLALFGRNSLEILSGIGGTDIDEAAIDYIKTIPAYVGSFNISTSDSVDTSIYYANVGYSNWYTTMVDSGRTYTNYSPLSYLSQFFSYARGGIIMRFKFVTTEFHSGRYAIMFVPFETLAGGANVAISGQSYVHREIIDLREGNEFTFHIPFTSIPLYRRLGVGTNESFGSVTVFAVNPLTAPATVASTCNVLVEVCGAPDVEFAYPRTNTLSIAFPTAPQSNINFVSSTNEITSGTIGNSTLNSDNHLNSRHCIGEKILSLSSLLRHNNEILPQTQGTTAISASINPFFIPSAGNVVSTAPADSAFIPDLYAMINSMFVTSRGSVRLKVFNNVDTDLNTSELTTATVSFTTSGTHLGIVESASKYAAVRWALKVIQNSIYRGGVDVQTPPYHMTYARCNSLDLTGSSAVPKDYSDPSSHNILINVNTAIAVGNRYYRQVGDDFQLGMFLTVPSCIAQ
jgi:hypothetical protein